jgi:hypothetical protein
MSEHPIDQEPWLCPTCEAELGQGRNDGRLDPAVRYFLAQSCAQGFHGTCKDPEVIGRIAAMLRDLPPRTEVK